MNYPERRMMPNCELRVDGEKEHHLLGYAAVFNALSEEMWGFREQISRGAFQESLKTDDVRMLWNHNPDYVLARNKAGTLTLWEDDKGLGFDAIAPDTQWARDLVTTIKRGDVTQNSFGFQIVEEKWDKNEKGKEIRTILKVKLFDVSAVTYPAYPQTNVFVRAKNNFYVLPEDKVFFIQPDPPASYLLDNRQGDDKAKPPIATPVLPLVTPEQWADIQSKNNRRNRK